MDNKTQFRNNQLEGTDYLRHGKDRDYNQTYNDDWKVLARENIEDYTIQE